MKMRLALGSVVGAAAAAALLAGCSYSANDKEVVSEFYDNMEYLNRPAAVADAGSRYRFAKELFNEVDVAGVKSKALLFKLVGKPTKVDGSGASQVLEYRFASPADGPEIVATFKCEGDKVVSGKVVGI